MKLLTVCLLVLVCLPLPLAAGPARAADDVWNLARTVITPASGHLDWELHSWDVSETGMDHRYTFPDPPMDNHQHFTFSKPDAVLEPGATVTLTASGTSEGSNPIVSGETFRYEGEGIELEGPTRVSVGFSYGNSADGYTRFVVPPLSAGTFTVRALMETSFGADPEGCTVSWVYEAGPPAPVTLFSGYAMAYDDHNKSFPIREAELLVRLENDEGVELYLARTDSTGLYTAIVNKPIKDNTKYRVQLAFSEPGNVFGVFWDNELPPVAYLTEERTIEQDRVENLVIANFLFEPLMKAGQPLRILDNGSLLPVQQRTVTEQRIAAFTYTRIYAAMTYGRDRLGVTYDHNLPLMVVVGGGGNEVSHYSQDGRINITPKDMPDLLLWPPDAVYYHEFGHYLSHDSTWFGNNVLPVLPSGDTNHGSVKNATSQDAVVEGAAEFLVLLFNGAAAREDGTAPYAIGSYPLNLQDNYYDYDDKQLNRWLPWEEWQFAALLWDIMDQDRTPEFGDDVAWGLSRVWQVLSGSEAFTVRGYYEAFKAEAGEPLPGPGDPPTALDEVFILHDFWAESNGTAGWQQGEAIGYANAWNTAVDADALRGPGLRPRPPVADGLGTVLQLPAGVPVPTSAQLTVYPAGEGAPWTATVYADRDGNFPLYVPASAERAELRWSAPGYRIETFSLSREAFRAAVESGQTAITAAPAAEPADIAPPQNVVIERESDISVSISWAPVAPGQEVVVVRGADHTPMSPEDGTIIYRGTDTRVKDTAVQTATGATYAVFTVDSGGGLSPAADLNATPTQGPIVVQTTTAAPGVTATGTALPSLPSRTTIPLSSTQLTPPRRSNGTLYFVGAGIAFAALIVVLVRRKSGKK